MRKAAKYYAIIKRTGADKLGMIGFTNFLFIAADILHGEAVSRRQCLRILVAIRVLEAP